MPQSTLTVWKFDTPDGARNAVKAVEDLQRENLLVVLDYATVSWERGKKRPTTKQGTPATSTAAVGGAFWGMLFGLIFFVPLLGAAIGAAAGALGGALTDVGIDDNFIKQTREEVTEGTSALFLLSQDAVIDRLVPEVHAAGLHPKVISTNLSQAEEEKLREAFA